MTSSRLPETLEQVGDEWDLHLSSYKKSISSRPPRLPKLHNHLLQSKEQEVSPKKYRSDLVRQCDSLKSVKAAPQLDWKQTLQSPWALRELDGISQTHNWRRQMEM